VARYWCRHQDCREPYDHPGGTLPPICPACDHVAAWGTRVDASPIPVPVKKAPGRVLFDLTANDRKLLKRLRIRMEE